MSITEAQVVEAREKIIDGFEKIHRERINKRKAKIATSLLVGLYCGGIAFVGLTAAEAQHVEPTMNSQQIEG